MAEIVVNTFNLYNTTTHWTGYSFPGYSTEQALASAYYFTKFSANPVGSQIDFFKEIVGNSNQNPTFSLPDIVLDDLPYLWYKYWWDEAVYYSFPTVYDALTASEPDFYQEFSDSVGTLYYLSRSNNLQNQYTKIYSTAIEHLFSPDISATINSFYSEANSLFLTNKARLGPGTGTDVSPGSGVNGTLIQADTDLTRRITSNLSLTAGINTLYPHLYRQLMYNTNVIGNTLVPRTWNISATGENSVVYVSYTNRNISMQTQLNTIDLI